MFVDADIFHRRSIRLKGYDYSQEGGYFVTVCVQGRECLLGKVKNGQMILNDAGRMVEKIWNELPKFYPGVGIDSFIVMPNHMHGIILLLFPPVGAGPRACPYSSERENASPREKGQPRGVAPTISLPDVMYRLKSLTTARYRHGVKQLGWFPFPGRLWQRNYHEHIVRDEDDANRIREYIADNPAKWDEVENNPRIFQPAENEIVASAGNSE